MSTNLIIFRSTKCDQAVLKRSQYKLVVVGEASVYSVISCTTISDNEHALQFT